MKILINKYFSSLLAAIACPIVDYLIFSSFSFFLFYVLKFIVVVLAERNLLIKLKGVRMYNEHATATIKEQLIMMSFYVFCFCYFCEGLLKI